MKTVTTILNVFCLVFLLTPQTGWAFQETPAAESMLSWSELPSLPDPLGVAGPFAGIHGDALIVAGGANFPKPVWGNDKVWHDQIHVLVKNGDNYSWVDGGRLEHPIGYGAAVSTPDGVVCMGGNDEANTFDQVFLLQWNENARKITTTPYPSLPSPCAFGAATLIGDTIYLAGGQSGQSLDSAMNNFWTLDLSKKNEPGEFVWQKRTPWPGPNRAFNITASQHNGYYDCVYVLSGRRQSGDDVQFLTDVWEFSTHTAQWRQRANVPRCVMAGTGIGYGQSHLFVLGGADGSLFDKAAELKDQHPGFPKSALAYHTVTNTWTDAGETPQNQVTSIAVRWGDSIVIPTGEIRPRVRSSSVWKVWPVQSESSFGSVNYIVLFGYLLAMVGVGFYFSNKNKNTDDYFRGGKQIPWWAAGCSIFATMLSSLTFTGIPSKAFAQDWVYGVGTYMVPLVALIAIYVALPFYRGIDATSAYEYLEKRFNRPVRLFGSSVFTLFHIFRMAVVMSLTGLALAVATPLTPAQSVLLMGVLSITYSTMGGIEAVIWTDTIQTVVLIGGAILAIILLIFGLDGGMSQFFASANESNKLAIANYHWDATNTQIALWVIIVGGIGQNISSYTADQAVVQRYMTTASEKQAARSIWVNAGLAIPTTVLFYGIGTALFAFYQAHPEKLDPTITTDQIFPLFIAREMPIGFAGLLVAAVFAAAQSTVSTSMNSTATTLVTDFLRPMNAFRSETRYLNAARVLTFLIGVMGTLLGLVFVNPDIKSLFDAFIQIAGLFMGVLGGLFVLGAMTKRANAAGALIGAIAGTALTVYLWRFTSVNGYLFAACGITSCFVVGYLASLICGSPVSDLTGLTVYTRNLSAPESNKP